MHNHWCKPYFFKILSDTDRPTFNTSDIIAVVAYPDCGAGNDPELFFFFGGGGGGVVFHTNAQHFYRGHHRSNDLPRPRRSANAL